jgi:hypothetical protein
MTVSPSNASRATDTLSERSVTHDRKRDDMSKSRTDTFTEHGRGHGRALFEWLLHHAKTQGCEQLHLDSGVQRFDAHRFYLGRGMAITAHHFAVKLK